MAEPFKNMYNKQFFDLFTKDLRLVIDDFDAHGFVSQIMDDEWEGRELKQRWIHITSILKKFLPADYKEAVSYTHLGGKGNAGKHNGVAGDLLILVEEEPHQDLIRDENDLIRCV